MWDFDISVDRETSERAGAGGMFQVGEIVNGDGNDFSDLIDQGHHFRNEAEVKEAILKAIERRLRVTIIN